MKILLYDIETAPNLAYVWGKWQQNVIAFKKEREMLSFAWSWLGEDEVHCMTKEGLDSDEALITRLACLIEEADMIVAHNGDEFDRKILKARMLYWGMNPLKINCSVDTKKVAKAYFGFNGNDLNGICKYLKIGKKVKTPGFDLWLGCLKDDRKSWATMAKYNRHDVSLLKRLYKKLLPWIENHPKDPAIKGGSCPNCKSSHLQKRGLRITAKTAYQQYQCIDCGKWHLQVLKKGESK